MQQLIQTGRYEDHILRLLRRLCRTDFTVLDVGANVGVHSLPLSRMAKRGTIHSFEPCGDTYAFLEENVARNKASNIVLWKAAVSNVDLDTVEISYTPEHSGGTFLSTIGHTEHSVQRVPTITLDGWADRNRPSRVDLIKMDIEGAEWMALGGAGQLLRRYRPRLIVECNASTLWRFHNKSPGDLFRILREHYPFVAAAVDREDSAVCRIDSEDDLNVLIEVGKGLEDLLCSPDEPDLPQIPLATCVTDLRERFGRVNLLPHCDMVVIQDIVFHDPAFGIEVLCPVDVVCPGQRFSVTASLKNTGRQVWSSSPPNPINVSYFWRSADGHVGVRDGLRTLLPSTVMPGDQMTLEVHLQAPSEPGLFDCCISLVHEGLCWFDQFHPESAAVFPVEVSRAEPASAELR